MWEIVIVVLRHTVTQTAAYRGMYVHKGREGGRCTHRFIYGEQTQAWNSIYGVSIYKIPPRTLFYIYIIPLKHQISKVNMEGLTLADRHMPVCRL